MRHWLLKSEPTCYSIDDLKRDKITAWTDVRNYQARNYLLEMKKGDEVLFYHSSCAEVGVVGVGKICREAYPDPTQFDPKNEGYDQASTATKPRWMAVDVRFVKKFKETVSLTEIKSNQKLTGIEVARQGSRLSVQPVSDKHFAVICQIGV